MAMNPQNNMYLKTHFGSKYPTTLAQIPHSEKRIAADSGGK
ncbi:hypothetical protein TREAZ_0294 [Leadbettera azotonutricia ZAS-9]|uniref:Uncharacterized protein n=1 Tax=Leadbettera azotonutricia (strain ATCC BAA-888 / DSM 13862 / ZAS-9) TaxID=545695 RepID=F5YDM7_LEAAZ|nr:hypothetical protein TREAZ_0294 [Leadbettera azotonutricia ZAS-9]